MTLWKRVAYSVAWPCAALSVGDELVVSTAAAKAAWAKLNDHSTSGGQAEAAHADALPAEFVEYQTKLQSKAMEEQLALAPSAMDDYLFDLKGFLVVRLTGGAFGSPHVARPNRTAHVDRMALLAC